MSCEDRLEALSAYADGEATAAERGELDRHLASCAECNERLDSLRSLKHGIAGLDGRKRPPDAVVARIEALRFTTAQTRRGFGGKRLLLAAVLTTVALTIVGRTWLDTRDSSSLTDELIADHMKYVPEAMPAEVASADHDVVRRFFDGKVPFEPVVPRIDGAVLLGGRLCRIRGDYEQLLFYERGGSKLSLYVSNQRRTTSCESRRGFHACGHRQDGLSWTLVGDAPPDELRELLTHASL